MTKLTGRGAPWTEAHSELAGRLQAPQKLAGDTA
jgi:hypothetical protein